MKYKIIGVFDRRLRIYYPFQCTNDVEDEDLIESHRRAVLTGKMTPDLVEFGELYYFGKFDDETGETFVEAKPKYLVSFADFLPRKEEVKKDGEGTVETQTN